MNDHIFLITISIRYIDMFYYHVHLTGFSPYQTDKTKCDEIAIHLFSVFIIYFNIQPEQRKLQILNMYCN